MTPPSERRGSDYWLVGLDGPVKRVRVPLKSSVLVGRGTYNHVVLKDRRISRQHARIALETEGCILYDLGSTNGTYVNGAQVRRQVLRMHDEVAFGSLTFRIATGSQGLAYHGEFGDLEEPTVRDVGSVSKLAAAARESSTQLPVVDLGQLEDAYQKLGTLYDFMQAISQTIESTKLVELIAVRTRDVYATAAAVAVYLLIPETGAFGLAHAVGDLGTLDTGTRLAEATAKILVDTQRPVLGPPPEGRTSGSRSMFAPIVDRTQVVGVIHVAAVPRTSFTRSDVDLLVGMAAPAAMMLRNARHHDESLARTRLDYDLQLAQQIQRSFLPREVVAVEGMDLFAEYLAAYSVGGDFYDVFWVAPRRLGVFIGDIAGKGVAGALLMARISSEMRMAALTHVDPVEVLTTMNKALIARQQPEVFFTAIYLTLDVDTGQVVLANAGHPMPYCARAGGGLEEITEGAGAPVGILDDPMFESTTLQLANGDSLVLYTDGVVEAAAADGSLYGSDRLERALGRTWVRAQDAAELILASVREHVGRADLNDDLTMLICQRNVGRPESMQPRRRLSGTMNRVVK